ncbi:MAG: GGDEF domain-containing protein [Burkholderiales bacterium]
MPPALNAASAPSEIARETIRQLALRKLAPSPDNYTRLYDELRGVRPERRRDAGWGELIRETLQQWDRRQAGLTTAKKRESLERVLGSFGKDGERLHDKLSGLVKGWRERGEDGAHIEAPAAEAAAAKPGEKQHEARAAKHAEKRAGADGEQVRAMREALARTLEYAVLERLGHAPALQEEARELAALARGTLQGPDLTAKLKRFFMRVELAGEDINELLRGLLGLLRLLTDNVAELVGDDRWMKGQVSAVQALLAEPLGKDMLREAERGFRDLVIRQGSRKASLDQTKSALKDMVAVFVDRLAAVSSSTGFFHERMAGYAQRIAETDDIAQLGGLVEELVRQTRGMQADVARAHEELLAARRLVSEHENRIRQLEQELEAMSGQVREDQLTRTLNRRGLDEAWGAEAARSERQQTPLCLSVLDLDNFKQLNDRLGHQAGDRALIHLADVVRQALRPSDIIARYGGEEFVVLLPHTPADEAVSVMVRLQRELTRHYFMHNQERILITFSAGVAERKANETRDDLLERADAALYEAKRTGKNRVVPAS